MHTFHIVLCQMLMKEIFAHQKGHTAFEFHEFSFVMQATLLGLILCNAWIYVHTQDLHIYLKNAFFSLVFKCALRYKLVEVTRPELCYVRLLDIIIQ